MKKGFSIFLLFVLFLSNAVVFAAQEPIKFKAQICCDYDPDYYINNYIILRPLTDVEYENVKIPKGTLVKAKIDSVTMERRFHKSGFLVVDFVEIGDGERANSIEHLNIGGVARKYEQVDKKDATLTGAELTTTTVAAFVIPGIDILYYFTKGFIQNTKADTRFKSGVHNAYDNSIMWFFLKGKPIKLNCGDMLSVLMCENSMITIKKNKSVKIKKVKE